MTRAVVIYREDRPRAPTEQAVYTVIPEFPGGWGVAVNRVIIASFDTGPAARQFATGIWEDLHLLQPLAILLGTKPRVIKIINIEE